MRFKIAEPWTQWLVKTKIGNETWTAKVDGGSALTLIGMNIAMLLGIDEATVIACPHVEYYDVSNATKHRTFRVPLDDIKLPLGRKDFKIPHIFIPFRLLSNEEMNKI